MNTETEQKTGTLLPETTSKPLTKKPYEFYFKVNDGVGTRSVAIDDKGLTYKFLEEGHYYSHKDLGKDAKSHIDMLLAKTEWVVVEKYRNDIGVMDDRGETPTIGKDENGKPIYGLPRTAVPLISKVSEKDYLEYSKIISKESKVSKVAPWAKGVQ